MTSIRRSAVLVLVIPGVLLLAGCPKGAPNGCSSSADCAAGAVCSQGACAACSASTAPRPSIACPAAIVAECTGNASAQVTPRQPTVTDVCNAQAVVPPAGPFPLGTTDLRYTASDAWGNSASCSASVQVVDTTPPQIACPADITAECRGGAARVDPGHATASDSCSAVTIAGPDAGNYPLGVTAGAFSATDSSGNRSSCTQNIRVVDTTPPQVSAGPSGGGPAKPLWPKSASFAAIDLLSDCQLSAADICQGSLTPSPANTSAGCVTVNEAALRNGGPDVVFVDSTHLLLWKNSASQSGGRIYRIAVQVKDAAGNAATATCRVDVGPGPSFAADSGAVAQTFCPTQPLCAKGVCGPAFFYAGGPAVHGFTINPASGALTELPSSPFAIEALRLAAHPSGKYLYATSNGTSTVGAYAIGRDGSLTAIGKPVATGNFPEAATVDPSGTHLYVGNIYGGGVSIYAIDPATGALTAEAPLASGLYNHGIAFDPTGAWLYLSQNNNDTVTQYAVAPSTGQASSPKVLAAAGGYHSAMDPRGHFLFVTDWDKSGANLVSVYAVSQTDGSLTKVEDHATGGIDPAGVVVTPDGRHLYVVNNSSGTLAMFSVGTDGKLTAMPGSPLTVSGAIWELGLDPTGRWLYLPAGATVLTYAIDPSTGALTQQAAALQLAGTSPTVGCGVSVIAP